MARAMTVDELIHQLLEFDGSLQVFTADDDGVPKDLTIVDIEIYRKLATIVVIR